MVCFSTYVDMFFANITFLKSAFIFVLSFVGTFIYKVLSFRSPFEFSIKNTLFRWFLPESIEGLDVFIIHSPNDRID